LIIHSRQLNNINEYLNIFLFLQIIK